MIAPAEKLDVKAEDSPTREGLKKGGPREISAKLKLKGKEFDEFYIDNEVSYYKAMPFKAY